MSDRTIEANSRLAVPGHVLSRKAGGETVLLNLENEEYYGLDGVGSRFWELMEAGTTFGHAVAALAEEYDVEASVIETDLRKLLLDLTLSQLVQVE